MKMNKVVIVGGGAAGMMAAIWAARSGAKVILFEKNEKLGKKVFITGKGRCNVTNACEIEELFQNIISNEKFMYSGLYSFSNDMTMDFFEEIGLKIKTERGNRVFPISDHSSDVIRVLEDEMKRLGVEIYKNTSAKSLICQVMEGQNTVVGVQLQNGKTVKADKVLLATGGVSYPLTGSTGDGHHMAEETGHKVTELYPALVPLHIKEDWCKQLMGLSLRNVSVTVKDGKKILYQEFGEMLFTHFGVSGPLILSASSYITKKLAKSQNGFLLECDLKPALTTEQLDKRLIREFDENHNKQFKNVIPALFPAKLVPVMIQLSGIDGDKRVNEITKEMRTKFVELIKHLPMTITATSNFKEAIITQGGVSVKNINPSTMESKVVKNLYFAGELIDIDALTGGYNLQFAWSTGYLAGKGMAE